MTTDWGKWEGQTVDGVFRLDRYLGGAEHSGTFATEYQGKKAAIKLRAGEPQSETGAQLSHPHLLPIYRVGRWQFDGAPVSYIVMEFADEVLANFIPERSLEPEEASETLAPVLQALGYLHGRGLSHGRIKPGNILSVGEHIKLSSDGLRRSGEMGRTGEAPSPYDAPEGRLTAASDVWSLGVTLVEILTQQRPVMSGAEEPVLPAALPPTFREIASHCLRRDPQRRWTVSQIEDRLAGRAPVEQMTLPRAAAPAAAAPESAPPRQSTATVAVVVIAIVVVIGAVFFLSRNGSEAPARPPAEASRQQPAPAAPSPAPPAKEKRSAPPGQRVRGKAEEQVPPQVSTKALDTISGRVRVRVAVQVDAAGKVTETKLDTPRVSRYFATAALQAARRWKFTPPAEDGNAVASQWVLEFDFARNGVQMHSRQVP